MKDRTARVLVVYQHLAHYRYAVFSELEKIPDMEFHFAAGSASKDGSIPVLSSDDLEHQYALRNHWIGPFLWQRGLLKILRQRWDAAIFLGDSAYLSTWVGATLLRRRGIPVFFWTIGWHRPESGLRKHYRLAFYRRADKLLLYGDVPRKIGTLMGYPEEKMEIIYNSSGGPAEKDQPTVVEVGPPTEAPGVIGAVIRLNARKRLDLIIDAAAELRSMGREVKVLIVGDGPEREALIKQASSKGVNLELPGAAYDPATIEEFYAAASVTVVPSEAGLTTVQSMRYGRPVVTHDNMYEQAPECEAIEHDVTGSFYREGDVRDLARCVAAWLDRQQDDPAVIADACHEAVSTKWSAPAQARLICTHISAAVNA